MVEFGLNFGGESSAVLVLIGLLTSAWIFDRTNNLELSLAVFFFFSLEVIQALQYLYVAPELRDPTYKLRSSCAPSPVPHPLCETFANQFLTLLGFLHICMQPYFVHAINSSLTKSCRYKDRYRIIKRLCLIGGILLFSRYFLHFLPRMDSMNLSRHPTTEWLRGSQLCTFKTKSMHHLGWSIPLADPSYYVMGASIHAFLTFAPFVALYEQKGLFIQGVFLLLTGPVLSSYLSNNLMERGSLWSFFSIIQILIMLFLIREPLLRGSNDLSVLKTVTTEYDGPCQDFIYCEYCNRTDLFLERAALFEAEEEDEEQSITDNDYDDDTPSDETEGEEQEELNAFSDDGEEPSANEEVELN